MGHGDVKYGTRGPEVWDTGTSSMGHGDVKYWTREREVWDTGT